MTRLGIPAAAAAVQRYQDGKIIVIPLQSNVSN